MVELSILAGSLLLLAAVAFFANRSGKRTGVDAVRAEVNAETAEAQDRMASAGAAGPQDGQQAIAALRARRF